MSLFDAYVMVDWSARSAPSPARPTKDAIWIAVARTGGDARGPGAIETAYIRTRAEAEARLLALMRAEAAAGRRLLVGFDFPFGYPAGVAARVAGAPSARALWDWLAAAVEDASDNRNNRYAVAGRINRLYPGVGPFWGRPASVDAPEIPIRKSARTGPRRPPERRACEQVATGAKSVWQLAYAGAVGSQVLVGLPMLARLSAALGPQCAVWPFDGGFAPPGAPVVLAEVYPSLFAIPSDAGAGEIGDERQVRATAAAYRDFDAIGALAEMFAGEGVLPASRPAAAREEAWILGLGHPALDAVRRRGGKPGRSAAGAQASRRPDMREAEGAHPPRMSRRRAG